MAVSVVHAEDAEWTAEIPKGGGPILVCTGSASSGGHSYRNTNYVFADADEEVEREARWQRAYCDKTARRAVTRWFLFRHGVEVNPADVEVRMELMR
jgi:hypothetical protein